MSVHSIPHLSLSNPTPLLSHSSVKNLFFSMSAALLIYFSVSVLLSHYQLPSPLFCLSINSFHTLFPSAYSYNPCLHPTLSFYIVLFFFSLLSLMSLFPSIFLYNLFVFSGLDQFIVFNLPSFITLDSHNLSVPLSIICHVYHFLSELTLSSSY